MKAPQVLDCTEGSRQPGETMVDWAYRWVTRGHWRKQPCGPGRAEIRVIWIAPHICGPWRAALELERRYQPHVQTIPCNKGQLFT